MNINPAFIDVPAPPGMGLCLPRTDFLGDSFPIFEDEIELVPEADWAGLADDPGFGLDYLVRKRKNQGQESSCASNAVTQTAEMLLFREFGAEGWVELSAMSVYKRVGSSAQSGSTINDNIREISTRGALPTDSPENRARCSVNPYVKHFHPNTGFSRSLPSGWESTGDFFMITEWYDIRSFAGMVTAIFKGAPVFYGRASHAIAGARVVYDKTKRVYMIKYANSWGDWGDDGFGYDTQAFIGNAISSYSAVAPRTIVSWHNGLVPLPVIAP